ncbi:MAG: pilus assembly protein [Planctomycetia bacterium]|nr:pilus assembly protein [Planctomycetia bacterium]
MSLNEQSNGGPLSHGPDRTPGGRRQTSRRRGAAAVEFALVAPLLFLTIIIPIFEFGRGFMVSELVTNAARAGCRVGVLPGNLNSAITSTVTTNLSGQGVTGATTTITVNGGTGDVSAAVEGDSVSVTVSVPYTNNSWIPGRFLAGKSITGTQTMRHE